MGKVKDGIEYELIKSRKESKINLVFIHGIGFNKRFFESIAKELGEYNCYLIDLPGHGGSEDSGFTFENYLNRVSDFLREIDSAVVIGHSLGGTIALAIALRRIHTVKGVMIIAGGAESAEYGEELQENINKCLTNINSFRESLGHVNNDLVSKTLEHIESNRIILEDLKISMSINILNSLGNINIPLTIISGEDDKLYPLNYAEHIHEKVKESRFVTFKDTGNMLPLVKEKEVVEEIKKLIEEIEH